MSIGVHLGQFTGSPDNPTASPGTSPRTPRIGGRTGSTGDADLRTMPGRFHRRSIRLKGYDYAQEGAYYVTICTHARAHLFGEVVNALMERSHIGGIAQRCWDAIPMHMPMVELDEFIVMPNHVHGFIVIADRAVDGAHVDRVGAGNFPPPQWRVRPDPPPVRALPTMQRGSLGHIIQTFKAAVSRQVRREWSMNAGIVTPSAAEVWQRGYYERIIRDAAEHDRIAQYIADNPANWDNDRFFR
jgi:REP element-mobilizing transposase RayT